MHLLCITLSAVVCNAAFAGAHPRLDKLRRGSVGLMPFPRVGRGSGQSWEVPPEEYAVPDQDRPTPADERDKRLYAFPRVGRVPWTRLAALRLMLGGAAGGAGGAGWLAKRNSDSGNMWFGPRLGRAGRDPEVYDEDSYSKTSTPEQGYPERAELTSEKRRKRESNWTTDM